MRRVLILCNALDDATRQSRGIATDSPAASRKVFMAARALAGIRVHAAVISQGRGRYTGMTRWHPGAARRHGGVPTCYLPFVDRPVLSQLVSVTAAALAVARRGRRPGQTVLVVYNRSAGYVPAIVAAKVAGMRVVLDLEDGYPGAGASLRERLARFGCRVFDALCGDRALLACTALGAATQLRPAMAYYGVADDAPRTGTILEGGVTALLGGTVSGSTGGELVAKVVELLRENRPAWASDVTIEVTGKGESIPRLTALAASDVPPRVRVWGRTTDAEYAMIRARVDVGLALKPNAGRLAQSTFPSKIIEMAAAGQLVLTTDISDVRAVLGGNGAVFVAGDTPAELIAALRWIVEHRAEARARAVAGSAAVARLCAPAAAGHRLAQFLFGAAERVA